MRGFWHGGCNAHRPVRSTLTPLFPHTPSPRPVIRPFALSPARRLARHSVRPSPSRSIHLTPGQRRPGVFRFSSQTVLPDAFAGPTLAQGTPPMPPLTILVVDDDPGIRTLLQ